MLGPLRAIVRLARTVRSLEETLIARTLLDYPQLEGIALEAYYQRGKIVSPLLKWVYDRRASRGWERSEDDVIVRPRGNSNLYGTEQT